MVHFRILVLLFIFIAHFAYAGSGWVGNNPIQVAFRDSQIYELGAGDNASAEDASFTYNSLLLTKGEQRFGVELGATLNGPKSYDFLLNYDIGLNDRWTLMNLTTFGYSLVSANQSGNELALFFGFTNGLAWDAANGLVLNFGTGLLHSYTWTGWRWTSSFELAPTYSSKNNWTELTLATSTALSRALNEHWSLGGSLSYKWLIESAPESNKMTLVPALDLTRKLGKSTWINSSFATGRQRGRINEITGSLRISTRW